MFSLFGIGAFAKLSTLSIEILFSIFTQAMDSIDHSKIIQSFRSKKEELYDEAMDEIQKMEKILTQRYIESYYPTKF